MKTLTTMTAIVALMAGISIASAQNSTTPNNTNPPPSSINAGGQSESSAGGQSGMQSSKSATDTMKKSADLVKGTSKFCITEASGSNNLNCKYASITACQKDAKLLDRSCSQNPNLSSTTGMKPKQ